MDEQIADDEYKLCDTFRNGESGKRETRRYRLRIVDFGLADTSPRPSPRGGEGVWNDDGGVCRGPAVHELPREVTKGVRREGAANSRRAARAPHPRNSCGPGRAL